MKIAVVGIGVVGNAIYQSLLKKNVDNKSSIVAYDKFKNIGKFEDILGTDMIFLCLPTPYSKETFSYDKSALNEVCSKLAKNKYKGMVIIKSTVEPTTTESFAKIYRLKFFHNPEFLTARTAYQDFHEQKHIIIGKTSMTTDEDLKKLVYFYQSYYPAAQISVCQSIESECVKLFCNCFYAVKVQFFNELYLVCQMLNINYDQVRNIMLKNGWINPMHTSVPGPDGQLSYGGMCFPKDTNALLSFMKKMNIPHAVLEGTVMERNAMRSDEN